MDWCVVILHGKPLFFWANHHPCESKPQIRTIHLHPFATNPSATATIHNGGCIVDVSWNRCIIHFSASASHGSGFFSFAHLRQLSCFKHVQAFYLCFSTQNDCKNSHRSAEVLRSLRAPKRGGSRSARTLQSTSPVQVSKFETHVLVQSWDLAWCLCNGKLGDPIPAIYGYWLWLK